MTPKDFQKLVSGNNPTEELQVEVIVTKRERDKETGLWFKGRVIQRHEIASAAIRVDRSTTHNDEAVTVVIQGRPGGLETMRPEGMPS